MSLPLMMDVQVPMQITKRLRDAGVDVLTAQEDGSDRLPDEKLLERAQMLGRIIFTQDQDFLAIAAALQRAGKSFIGVFFGYHAPERNRLYGDWLETFGKLGTYEDVRDQVIYLS
jgi:hypothetical protein